MHTFPLRHVSASFLRPTGRRLAVTGVLLALVLVTLGLRLPVTDAHAAPTAAQSGDVYSGYKNTFNFPPMTQPIYVRVGTLPIPAGKYTITAKAYVDIAGANQQLVPNPAVKCVLTAGSNYDQTVVQHDGDTGSGTMYLSVVNDFGTSSGVATLDCTLLAINNRGPVDRLSYIKMTAIATNNLSNVSL